MSSPHPALSVSGSPREEALAGLAGCLPAATGSKQMLRASVRAAEFRGFRSFAAVARAIPSDVSVFHVAHVQNGWGDLPNHRDNVENYVHRLSELLGKAKRARVHGDWYQREALELREELRRYLAFFDLHDVAIPESGELDVLQAWIAAHEEEERQRREEAARLAEEERCKEQAERIQRFRAGDPNTRTVYGVPAMLRIVGDEVQTSLGVSFPVEHARLGLRAVRKVRETGEAYQRNGHSIHLGHYVIDRIEPNGTVYAGCHVVTWDEIEHIAPELESSGQMK